MLLSETREERNWDKANEGYEDVQRFIIRADQLELYGDVERLVPSDIQPTCLEMTMEIEPYVRDDGPPKRVPKSPRAKKSKDPNRNIPSGASKFFVTARDLVPKKPVDLMASPEVDSDSDDREIEAGIYGPRRTNSVPATSGKGKGKGKKKELRRAVTTATAKSKGSKAPRKKPKANKLLPDLASMEVDMGDDSEDAEIEAGIFGVAGSKHVPVEGERPRASTPRTDDRRLSPVASPTGAVIDLTNEPEPLDLGATTFQLPPSSPDAVIGSSPVVESSSLFANRGSTSPTLTSGQLSARASSISSHNDGPPPRETPRTVGWLLDSEDEEPLIPALPATTPPSARRGFRRPEDVHVSASTEEAAVAPLDDDEVLDERHPHQRAEIMHTSRRSPAQRTSSGPASKGQSRGLGDMPPPPLPVRFAIPSTPPPHSSPEVAFPESSFAVRDPTWGKKRGREAVDSSPVAVKTPTRKRIQRGRSHSPEHDSENEPEHERDHEPEAGKPKRKKRKFRDIVDAQKRNPWIDVEASHSGDDQTDGGSEGDELGDEADRRFVQELPATQASPSYDQTAVYRRSLMTQAPGGSMPAFAHRPLRRGGYVYAAPERAHAPVLLSSSPLRQESDDYEFDSFIVGDDEDIVYNEESTILSDD